MLWVALFLFTLKIRTITMLKEITPTRNAQEAITCASMNFQVRESDVIGTNGLDIPDHKLIYREDTLEPLSVVGQGYRIIQNQDCFSIFDKIMEKSGGYYERAACLKQGRQIILQASCGESFDSSPGDTVKMYLTLVTSHDGSSSLRMMLSPVRLACLNQLATLNSNATTSFSLKHTINADLHINDIFRAFGLAQKAFYEFRLQSQHLARKRWGVHKVNTFIDRVIPDTGSTRVKNQRDTVIRMIESGRGNNLATVTAWQAMQGLVEWIQYERSQGERAIASNLLGSGLDLKRKALAVALSI
ncbi:MAG: DUF932 domain-containing protein [Fibrobacteria bacterium]|nr:DUF932 domain-containing protein [Fibrobacteria bacterium]